ncbi:hypothetical protein M758_1G279600 [Ceratodon purpureus]|nr:hypothetical protein M758_1G279600 [Ceratodon purpureus]
MAPLGHPFGASVCAVPRPLGGPPSGSYANMILAEVLERCSTLVGGWFGSGGCIQLNLSKESFYTLPPTVEDTRSRQTRDTGVSPRQSFVLHGTFRIASR